MQHTKYVLSGGVIFDSHTGNLKRGLAILIENGRIAAVCEPEAIAHDATWIEVNGKTILPGLIDVHVHSEEWHAPLYLAKGITTVRDVGCELEAVLNRRERWNAGQVIAPHLVCTGPLLDCPGNTWKPMTLLVQTPQEARQQVDYLVQRGVDQIKAYAYLNWECFEAIVDQAHQHQKFVVAHLGKHTDAYRAVHAGLDEIEHLSGIGEALWPERNTASPNWEWLKLWSTIDTDRMNRLVDLLLEKRTWVAITRLVWQRLATLWDPRHYDHPQMRYVPEPLRHFWTRRFSHTMALSTRQERSQQVAAMAIFTTELIRQGAKILVGTDTPFPHLMPGFSFHDEIQALLECGMSEAAVLQAATLAGAQALGIADQVGSIEAGKIADLVIVNGDPLTDMRTLNHIEAVIRAGQWLRPSDLLDEAAVYAQQGQRPHLSRFDENY